MIELKNFQELRDSLSIKEGKTGLKHTINKKSKFLPFMTRGTERPKFKEGFEGILGEFTRNICGMQLNKALNLDDLVKKISANVEVSEKDYQFLDQILRLFLQDKNGSIKVFHPSVFQYLPLNEGPESRGEQEISKFLCDILIEGDTHFKYYFQNSQSEDLISRLVLTYLDGLKENPRDIKYTSKLNHISNTFKDDFEFLYQYEDYFKSHYGLFVSYYYFFYITQITLKMAQKTKADFQANNEMYYTLDWEPTSKNRKGYTHGYQIIKEASRKLLIDINVLEHLNTLFGLDTSQSYSELYMTYELLTIENKKMLEQMIREWIEEYRRHLLLPEVTLDINFEYSQLVLSLYDSIAEAYEKSSMQGPQSRYPLSIEEIGKKFFMKTRGSLGYMLNASQDLLLLMTALSLKKERKSLKQVFKELESRGLYFDRYSKEEIVNLYDKLNLLDKKSDSGDAQYVKPIL